MKIAISATGPTLDAEVDPRFGRCQYFIIADPETMEFEALDNSNAMAAGGASISTGQMIAGKGVEAVLTGNCSPNAYRVLSAAGIQVITGVSGKIRDAVQGYKSDKFQSIPQPTVSTHFGMGMGKGGGRRMGEEMMAIAGTASQVASQEQELEALKAQSQMLAQKLADIQHRIEELKKKGR